MKTIIVDDEPRAIDLIASYLVHFSDFELVATFRNGLKALEYLNTEKVDVLFLDINMPHFSGLSLAKLVGPEVATVFTTAYSEYAVESYTIDVVDYLLKPISLERFSQTATKLIDQSARKEVAGKNREIEQKKLFIKSGLETHQIAIDSIEYLKKDGNYIYYVLGDRKVMARQSVAEAMAHLTIDFLQIQKSYIVNFKKMTSINSDYVTIGEVRLPIGSQFKEELFKRIK